jgi:hypothetical protein
MEAELVAVQLIAGQKDAETRFLKSLTSTFPGIAYEVLSVRRLRPPDHLIERNR